MIINLPNIITFIRLLVLPFFLHKVFVEDYKTAFILFLIGSITDFLDGFLARLLKQQTTFGSFFDPIVDKIFLLSSIIVLSIKGLLPKYFSYTILIRDTLVITGTVFLVFNDRIKNITPNKSGKFLILLEFLIVLIVLSDKSNLYTISYLYLKIMIIIAIINSVISLYFYGKDFFKRGGI